MNNANLYALIRERFPADAGEPCLLLPDGGSVSYRMLDTASARIAHLLRQSGCERGDRVAAQVDKSVGALALYLASLRAGLVYLPLNTGYQPREVAYFLNDANPRVVVCSTAAMPAIASIAPRDAQLLSLNADGTGTMMEASRHNPDSFEPVVVAPDELASILYTSGTTGRSKGAMLSHRNLASNALTLVQEWGFSAGDVLYHALPIYHVHGLFVATHCVLLSGSRMWFCAKFDVAEARRLLPRSTVMMGVPTFYTRLLNDRKFTRDDCGTIRLFVSGSAPLLPETFAQFESRTGQRILERYGMTETGMNTSNPLHGERIAGTVGRPLPGIEVRIAGDDGRALPQGEIGGIEVRGPNVFRGYWQMPEKTAEEFTADGYFKTGDMGRILDNGYVQIVGREKDMIITGGLNVYPKEIEELIDALPGVVESAVIGVPHPDFGEAVTAIVVAPEGSDVTAQTVLAALRNQLASFKMPKRVHIVRDLPRNAMGKVQKNVLREQFGG